MPRSGPQGTATPPPGTFPKNPGDIIPSAAWNQLFSDLYAIANTPTPIAYGGTGRPVAQLADGLWRFENTTDPSKVAAFDLSAITTATTRTYSFPDVNGDIITTGGQVLTGAKQADVRKTIGMENGYPLFQAVDEKPFGTPGGSVPVGNTLRTLNTVRVNEFGAVLASNAVTLLAGTYWIEASAPAYAVGRHKLYLRNDTLADLAINGSSEYVSADNQSRSFVSGRVVVPSTQQFSLRHYVQNTVANQGLGVETNTNIPEVYTELKIWKLK